MRRNQKGYVLFLMAAVAFVLCGACGLAFDVGRMYITKNELQAFADSAALAATLRLDGTDEGLTRARDEVTRMASLVKWNMGTQQPSSSETTVEFGLSINGAMPSAWFTTPPLATNMSYTRVRVSVNMPVYMVAAVTGYTTYSVAAQATAGQVAMTGSPIGMFPFTPIAHNNAGPNYGLNKGVQYTLKWASSPKLNGCPLSPSCNVCGGDQDQVWIDRAESRGAENRGYFGEQTSSSTMRDQVANDEPVAYFGVGDLVPLTGGAKSTVKDALHERINADPDPTSTTFDQYMRRGHTRRIITVPITDPLDQNRVLGFGRFFLLPADSYQTSAGNEPWCAVYLGPGGPEGSDSGGASEAAGLTRVRLADE